MTRARDLSNFIGSGSFSSTTFTATAGQTVFTIAHTQGFVQVFMNGLLLDLTVDYTSNGSAITLTSAAVAGDEIEVVKYDAFSVGDAIRASGGTFTGSIDASAGLVTPAGHVIQIQNVTRDGASNSTTSTSFVDTGLSLNITPTYSNSKIVVMVHQVTSMQGSSRTRCDFRCIESNSSTEVYRMDYHGTDSAVTNTQRNLSGSGVFQCSNTNQLTFKTQIQKANSTSNEVGNIYYDWYSESKLTMIALEIAQ